MEMVMKTEPVFTWFYSCNKSLRGQCSPVLPARDVGYSPCPTCGAHCPILNSFAPKKTYRWLTNTWKDAQHPSLSDKCKAKPQWSTISGQSGWLLSKHLQASNPRGYAGQIVRDLREVLARDKDFFTSIIKPKPTYLGEKISLDGSGDITNDK